MTIFEQSRCLIKYKWDVTKTATQNMRLSLSSKMIGGREGAATVSESTVNDESAVRRSLLLPYLCVTPLLFYY